MVEFDINIPERAAPEELDAFEDTIGDNMLSIASRNIGLMLTSIGTPEWSRSASSCVEVLKDDLVQKVKEALEITRDEGIEVGFAICRTHNFQTTETDIVRGQETRIEDEILCDGGWRLVDFHTHPEGHPSKPSARDMDNAVTGLAIPTKVNSVVMTPDGEGTCINFLDLDTRLKLAKTSGRENKGEMEKLRDEIIESESGKRFTLAV